MTAPMDNRGFTLVELLIALTIFAIGLLALAGMQLTAIQANSSSDRLSLETAAAQGIMEEIRSWRPNDGRLEANHSNLDWTFPDNSTVRDGMTAKYSITTSNPVTDVATVSVTVTGPTGGQVTLTEYKKTVF